jgi:hypothetical protein
MGEKRVKGGEKRPTIPTQHVHPEAGPTEKGIKSLHHRPSHAPLAHVLYERGKNIVLRGCLVPSYNLPSQILAVWYVFGSCHTLVLPNFIINMVYLS